MADCCETGNERGLLLTHTPWLALLLLRLLLLLLRLRLVLPGRGDGGRVGRWGKEGLEARKTVVQLSVRLSGRGRLPFPVHFLLLLLDLGGVRHALRRCLERGGAFSFGMRSGSTESSLVHVARTMIGCGGGTGVALGLPAQSVGHMRYQNINSEHIEM